MKSALLALASCAVALLLAESLVRMLPAERRGFVYRDGAFAWPREYEPSLDELRRRTWRHRYQPGPRAPDTTRVILLGDSFVEGLSVSDEETVGARLEQHLRAQGEGGFEVVAWGHAGWGPKEELDWLRQHGPDAAPDLVVTLFLVFNDVAHTSSRLRQIQRRQHKLVARRMLRGDLRADRVPLFFIRGSVLNQWISYRLALSRSRAEAIPNDYFVYAVPETPLWTEAWQGTWELLLATRRRAGELGADYAIVSASTLHGVLGAEAGLERLERSYPAMRDLEWDLDQPDRRLAAFCAKHGIPFLALEPVFREATRAGGSFHWKYDGHWNPSGNDLAARRIAEFLLGPGVGLAARGSALPK